VKGSWTVWFNLSRPFAVYLKAEEEKKKEAEPLQLRRGVLRLLAHVIALWVWRSEAAHQTSYGLGPLQSNILFLSKYAI
jgi:hypothetical protein